MEQNHQNRRIRQFKGLQQFDISDNQIIKSEGLDNLKNIQNMHIGGNSLSIDEINQGLNTMPNLETLGINNLGLTTLPDAVMELKQLKTL